MKHLARIFAVLGFIFQYLCPLALIATVTSLTHEGTKAGLTTAGILCLVVLALVLLNKLKNRVLLMKNNIVKQSLLSVSPFAIWGLGFLVIKYLSESITTVSAYWIKIAPFILIGRLLYIVSGIFKNEQIEREEQEKENALVERVKNRT